MIIYNVEETLPLIMNMSANHTNTSHSLHGCVCWYFKHVVHCFTVLSMLAFMLIQHTDFLTGSYVLSSPLWVLCNLSKTSFSNVKGIIIHLPFIATPYITAISCLIDKYLPRLGSNSSCFCGHPLIMCACSFVIMQFHLLQL